MSEDGNDREFLEKPVSLFDHWLTAFGMQQKTDVDQACRSECATTLSNLLAQAQKDNVVLSAEADPPVDNVTHFHHTIREDRIICSGWLGSCTAQVFEWTDGQIEFK